MTDESKEPDPHLLTAAIADRETAPWRYYKFEREELKRFLDQQLAKIQALTAERDALKAQLAGLVPPPWEDKWQPMETAPKDGTDILAFDCGLCIVTSWVEVDGWQGWWETGKCEPPPTHWMPLPSSPLRSPKET